MKHLINRRCVWLLVVATLAFFAPDLASAAPFAGLPHAHEWLPVMPFVLGEVFYMSPNTGDSLATMDPESVRKLWQAGVDVFEQSEDFFDPMEGGQNALIETVTDTSKGKGQTIRFEVMSGFYMPPHKGDRLFEDKTHFEKIRIDGNNLTVDFLRHATKYTERMEELVGMRGEIVIGLNEESGKWLGRLKTEQLFMMYREDLPETNIVFAGGHSLNTLVSADTLKYDEILALNAQLKRLGGLPAQTGKSKNGQPIYKNAVIACSDALFSLDMDAGWRSILATTRSEEDAKTIFEGGYTNVKGNIIKEYMPIDHDGIGPIGSPINAKATLGVAITAGTASFDLQGGGDAESSAEGAASEPKIQFFRDFPNYAYEFLIGANVAVDSDTHYLMIINPPNDPVSPNKWGMYAYTTGNNGNKITITGRLGATISGIRNSTLGDVTWNASPALTAAGNTDAHPEGSLILPCNSKGTILGCSLMLGRRSARRGYGKWRNRRTQQDHEGGFVQDRFITTVFGQAPRRDRKQRVPGALVLWHAMKYAGVPTPVIV